MNELVTVLPPLLAGGARWIRAFENLDGRLDGQVKVQAINHKARCEGSDDRELFNNVRGTYWDAVRDVYPQEQPSSPGKLGNRARRKDACIPQKR